MRKGRKKRILSRLSIAERTGGKNSHHLEIRNLEILDLDPVVVMMSLDLDLALVLAMVIDVGVQGKLKQVGKIKLEFF